MTILTIKGHDPLLVSLKMNAESLKNIFLYMVMAMVSGGYVLMVDVVVSAGGDGESGCRW